MPNYSRGSVLLVRFPFSDLTSSKVRPAIVVSAAHPSQDLLIVPLTSRTERLQPGEFAMLIAYGGHDNFNGDSENESFRYYANLRGIEQEVVVTEHGCEVITGYPCHELVTTWLPGVQTAARRH